MSHHINTNVLPEVLLGEANHLVQKLSKEQLIWLGGYLSGVGLNTSESVADAQQESVINTGSANAIPKLKVLVGSHSGNGKAIAKSIVALANAEYQQVEVINMADYKSRQIKNEDNLLIIISTHGEGEPPADAEELYRFLGSKRVGDLSRLHFSVIALGDSSYRHFCKTGLDFHERLLANGATAINEPYLLDVDFKEQLNKINNEVLQGFQKLNPNQVDGVKESVTTNSLDGFFHAEVIEKVLLNGRGSKKETYHIELDIEGSGLTYQPGDALEVYAVNDAQLVQQVLIRLKLEGSALIEHKEQQLTLEELLLHHKEITLVTLLVLKNLSAYITEPDLNRLLDNRDELDDFLEGSDLLDVLNEFSIQVSPQQLADALRTLPPRAYSIASSQNEVGDEVHLTVGAVRYEKNNRQHEGACSIFLIDRVDVGDKVAVKVKTNDGFRLPSEQKDIVMIGAGTGIAPYRAFIQERSVNAAEGSNWLIFGDQHFETDFLYQTEWLKYRKNGQLNLIDVAFSRDQDEKIYVQHRLWEKADELYTWIQNGASIYVCGDRKKMAKDVQSTFLKILQEKGKLSVEEAEKQLLAYRKAGRYQEDVY